MGGDQGDAATHAAQGQGDAATRGARQSGGDAVHQFALHTVLRQPVRLFRAATEDAGVATFQAHDALALARVAQHQAMDERLGGPQDAELRTVYSRLPPKIPNSINRFEKTL